MLLGAPAGQHSAPSSPPPPSQARKAPRVEAPTGFRRGARPFPQRRVDAGCEYRGFVITATQGSGGSWSASFARKGQENVTLSRRFSTTHPARALAIADAELEIDELIEQAAR